LLVIFKCQEIIFLYSYLKKKYFPTKTAWKSKHFSFMRSIFFLLLIISQTVATGNKFAWTVTISLRVTAFRLITVGKKIL
jgi:hypothetical protein